MKMNLARTAAAVAAFGFSGLTQAVPLYFDFTGTVSSVGGSPYPSPNEGRVGQNFSAGFTFETDRLFWNTDRNPSGVADLCRLRQSGPDASSSHLTIGGETFAFPSQPYQYTMMTFNDACSPAPPNCTHGWAEDIVLFGFSSDMPLDSSNATGTFRSTSLLFLSSVPSLPHPTDPATRIPAFDYFDVTAGIDPTVILNLPMYDLFATFSVSETICNNGSCVGGASEQMQLNVTGVTRGIASTSVPEPGTLGLLGVALAGMWMLRRRQYAPLLQR